MHSFIEKGMRGGIFYIAKRHSKANNKYMECYDSTKERKYIVYLDANNLHGWAISLCLPYNGFKWINQTEIDRFDVDPIDGNSLMDYILEVDFKYPSKFH